MECNKGTPRETQSYQIPLSVRVPGNCWGVHLVYTLSESVSLDSSVSIFSRVFFILVSSVPLPLGNLLSRFSSLRVFLP